MRGLQGVFRLAEAALAAGATGADAETLVEVVSSCEEEVGSLAVAVQNCCLLSCNSSVGKSDIDSHVFASTELSGKVGAFGNAGLSWDLSINLSRGHAASASVVCLAEA